MVLLEFSMSPLDKGISLSPYVARSLDIIDKSGLPYQLTPMGTIVEDEWDQVMALVTGLLSKDEPGLRQDLHLDTHRLSRGKKRTPEEQDPGCRKQAGPHTVQISQAVRAPAEFAAAIRPASPKTTPSPGCPVWQASRMSDNSRSTISSGATISMRTFCE